MGSMMLMLAERRSSLVFLCGCVMFLGAGVSFVGGRGRDSGSDEAVACLCLAVLLRGSVLSFGGSRVLSFGSCGVFRFGGAALRLGPALDTAGRHDGQFARVTARCQTLACMRTIVDNVAAR